MIKTLSNTDGVAGYQFLHGLLAVEAFAADSSYRQDTLDGPRVESAARDAQHFCCNVRSHKFVLLARLRAFAVHDKGFDFLELALE